MRVALSHPAWLVLGESYDSGWQARCDGRSLGAPQLIDGYANGWVAPAGCRNVSFQFSPQSTVNLGYVISGAVALALALLLIVIRPPARAARDRPAPLRDLGVMDAGRRLSLPRAAALAVALAVVLGFVFAKRAGIVIAVGLFVIFWRGYGPRALAAAAGARAAGGRPHRLSGDRPPQPGRLQLQLQRRAIYAHWLGVAAVIMLGLAVWMTLRAARRWTRSP